MVLMAGKAPEQGLDFRGRGLEPVGRAAAQADVDLAARGADGAGVEIDALDIGQLPNLASPRLDELVRPYRALVRGDQFHRQTAILIAGDSRELSAAAPADAAETHGDQPGIAPGELRDRPVGGIGQLLHHGRGVAARRARRHHHVADNDIGLRRREKVKSDPAPRAPARPTPGRAPAPWRPSRNASARRVGRAPGTDRRESGRMRRRTAA